ncbi:MAG: T9SS type A sorting domain-containing protein [Ignavibacterium sp.]|nr:T9SS type A sorting domain-containing protein [Ignavibacterium sp.]
MKVSISFLYIIIFFSSQIIAQWNKVEEITSPFVYSAFFDDDNIYVGGDSLYISRDRGLTWQSATLNGQAIEITALFKSDNRIFAGTYGNGVYVSSNNGLSWQSYNSGLGAFALYAKKFVLSGDTIFYATDGGGIYYLLSNSSVWQSYNQNLPSNIAWTINDLVATNNNLIASAGASGYYYLRPKGSAEWIEKRMQTPQGIFMTPNALFSTGDIVFSGHRFGIYKSLDEGNTFDSVGISAMDMAVVSFVMDENRIYAGYTRSSGNDFFVWYSDDLGQSWNIFAHEFQFLHHLYIYDNKIWAATNNGLWYTELETTSVDPIGKPNYFKLEQNYPNPFNPSTKISWQSPVGGWQTLMVYDILGNEVAALVDEDRHAGNYDISFDASRLASGIYFYKLQIGSHVETRKMILLR